MIAVLADDFTGAAEVAAIGRRYGLTAEVHTRFQPDSSADLVVVDTLTRSCSRDEAARRVAETVAELRAGRIECVHYKKVDSVLRGHVVAELARLMKDGGLRRTLLVPANPSFGQLIRDGRYSIGGLPLSETWFAHDPEHPAATSDVLELLGRHDGLPIAYREAGRDLPEDGIVVTGGVSPGELLALAEQLDRGTLPAGGAEFFEALLYLRLGRAERPQPGHDLGVSAGPTLLTMGSSTEPSRILLEHLHAAGTPIVSMPTELYEADGDGRSAREEWAARALECLATRGHAILAVDSSSRHDGPDFPVDRIPDRLGDVAAAVTAAWTEELHLYVSGGTTASMVVRRLGWSALSVVGELGHGVVALRPRERTDNSITVKPGSYPWPEEIVRALT